MYQMIVAVLIILKIHIYLIVIMFVVYYIKLTYFLEPMKVFKKFMRSKYLHCDARSSIGSPDEPLLTFFLYKLSRFFQIVDTSFATLQKQISVDALCQLFHAKYMNKSTCS